MKTYFQYEGEIKSHDLSLAISSVAGVGAQCGFGFAEINSNRNTITVYPKPNLPDLNKPGLNDMADRITRRRMLKPSDSGESINTNFVCVARDGAIFSSDQESIADIPIRGTKGMLNEVFLFAVHTPITEPIDNPVEFVACWNESSTEFYELYRKTLDVYYPIPQEDRKYDIDKNSPYIDKFNFTALENAVLSSSEYYQQNQDNAVLIAIYGTGTNTTDGSSKIENFTIIPYKSQFPQPIPYNLMERTNIHQSIKHLEKVTKGFEEFEKTTGKTSIKDYIDAALSDLKKEFTEELKLAILPIGSIILWEGQEIPKGWAEYNKTIGRIVVGHKPGGITLNGKQALVNNGDMYNPTDGAYEVTIDDSNLPKHRHSMGVTKGRMDNAGGADRSVVQSFTNKDSSLDGDIGYLGATLGIQSGAVASSYNLVGKSFNDEANNDTLVIEKLPPSVTLKYIIKVS